MDYQILTAGSAPSLTEEVKAAIDAGWTPVGGVSVYAELGLTQFAQAMVKGDARKDLLGPLPTPDPQSGMIR
jgi:hypothetical protein